MALSEFCPNYQITLYIWKLSFEMTLEIIQTLSRILEYDNLFDIFDIDDVHDVLLIVQYLYWYL